MKRDELKSDLYGVLTKHMHITHDGSDDHVNNCLSEILLRLQLNCAPPFVAKQNLSEDDVKKLNKRNIIQRYNYGTFIDDEMEPCDDGEYVKYEDHLKEVEALKPKWIPGPPTKTGWHWLKYALMTYAKDVQSVDNNCIMVWGETNPEEWRGITHHCPIQEPEDA